MLSESWPPTPFLYHTLARIDYWLVWVADVEVNIIVENFIALLLF